jgi:hypothetical protein
MQVGVLVHRGKSWDDLFCRQVLDQSLGSCPLFFYVQADFLLVTAPVGWLAYG